MVVSVHPTMLWIGAVDSNVCVGLDCVVVVIECWAVGLAVRCYQRGFPW